jgi:hypothetical protein
MINGHRMDVRIAHRAALEKPMGPVAQSKEVKL